MTTTQSRNALITGASGGIGSATVRRLDELGWRVFAGVRSPQAGEKLARGAGSVTPIELDLTDDASIARAEHQVSEQLAGEGLHGLVNNAGVIVQGPLELVPREALRRQFEVNVIGQVAVTQAFLPMLRSAGGRLVNIGAASGRVTVPMLGPISASKTALESLTDALRMELKHQGVRVSIIEPGALETEIFDKAAEAGRRDGYAGTGAAQRLYDKAIEAMKEVLAQQKTSPVDGVVKTIVRALTERNPASRYVVGRDASQLLMLRKLPEGLRDRLLMSNLGLKQDVFDARGR
jgi:NAD(P)-dependent dehydrogenase (short-subunit alcohol dehydrogenase family)